MDVEGRKGGTKRKAAKKRKKKEAKDTTGHWIEHRTQIKVFKVTIVTAV